VEDERVIEGFYCGASIDAACERSKEIELSPLLLSLPFTDLMASFCIVHIRRTVTRILGQWPALTSLPMNDTLGVDTDSLARRPLTRDKLQRV